MEKTDIYKVLKIPLFILRLPLTLLAFLTGWYFLDKYEYLSQLPAVDNLTGMVPVAFILIVFGGITALIWMKHSKRFIAVSTAVLIFVIGSAALFPTALRGNWRINTGAQEGGEARPDLSVYAPFSANSQTAKLDGKSTLTFSGSLPLLDGATALYPVYAAFAEAVYDESSFSQDDVLCTNTSGAYKAVTAGERDIVFVASPSVQQLDAARDAGAELKFTPIGREAFVFLTGKGNPLDNITYQQIRNIYSGKTARWQTLGWKEGGRIIAFQRPEGSGSQTGLQNVMGRLPIQVPQPLPDKSLIGDNSLMRQVSVEWKGVQPAIGYSYRFYAAAMYPNPEAKMLRVNGTEPSIENIRNRSYPFVNDFYAVTKGEPQGNSKLLIDWILSPQGQEIIEKTGYAPIN